MADLSKRDAEDLLAVLTDPPADLGEEVDGLRHALCCALGKTLALPPGAPWAHVVDAASRAGGWPEQRRAALVDDDLERAREAMWDLAAELNERRRIAGPAHGDGHRQREVVSAIERATRALRSGDAGAVRSAADTVAELDAERIYAGLPAALRAASASLDGAAAVPDDELRAIEAALGPGPLAAAVAQLRGG